MWTYGKASKLKLLTCHGQIQLLCWEAIAVMDITVVCGYRDKKAQNKAFEKGYSNVRYPDSNHNVKPSKAVDLAPWNNGIDWDDKNGFYELAGIMKALAFKHDIKLKWGGDFNGFFDGAHYEIQTRY